MAHLGVNAVRGNSSGSTVGAGEEPGRSPNADRAVQGKQVQARRVVSALLPEAWLGLRRAVAARRREAVATAEAEAMAERERERRSECGGECVRTGDRGDVRTAQQEEIEDGANLTISFAGELLEKAEELIRKGLHPNEIIVGYNKAVNKAIEILVDLVEEGSENMDVRNKQEVVLRMRSAVASKQFSQEDILCPLIADIAVFVGGVDTSATETKGTVLIHSAEQLENYAKTEEAEVEKLIKAVADTGANVIVSGATVGDMALHFCERYKSLKLSQPNGDELGYADSVSVEEIGGLRVTVVKNEEGENSVATVVLRGNTDGILDDLERVVDDGVNTYKSMCRDSRIIPGAAATEIELARRLKEFSLKETGYFALKYSADVVCTALRVDQIIMSKPAGGPRKDALPGGMDED
ncbi:hypothetical protein PR202_ga12670 [Eleusine coracana subsp. coracana]|uniref:Uncharacterized protein n=1 Tax=Eleusine coracana subsp. coracana TaxID=191504 RepID=A0AAV5CCR1_ELECO|nr:hypothetical protein PR202_ga12670 [Eleusine coracana subsp. coracana]